MSQHILSRLGRFRPRPKDDRERLAYVRQRYHKAPADFQVAVLAVVDIAAPAACWAQRRVLAVVLTRALLAPAAAGFHVELGRHHLAEQAGIRSLKTVTSALGLIRGSWVWAPVHGRHRQGCSIYTATAELVAAIYDALAATAKGRQLAGYRDSLHAKRIGLQRVNGGRKDTPLSGYRDGPAPSVPPAPDPELTTAELAEREQRIIAEQARRELWEQAEQAAIAERRAKHDAWRRQRGLIG